MKKLKFLIVALVTLVFIAMPHDANAWKLFGKEKTREIGVNELDCGPGQVGLRTFYVTYFFGIRVGGGSTTDCVDF